ncbi:hypothetical protein TG4357_01536 [Thalassovita gelatinovora]|uniref:Oligosaccharyl transferase, archaeosortase A system-associated n=1 Tax=Thalassovita gelatinovora TaxID=53501 RepID=A0A0P1F9Y9_THAGE|nr:hypothetical protein [Thalassovita gelatinovora]QIZ81130.1 hypothetical protein HFZ77_11930 [Thalassovita gelatinovora]CUH64854.1 hypothetical protein TG4357_01536 [Thalassovita gelatinovora]SEP90877.1 hypothetical protein SAMN04488043_102139 [Thalassovita gelatinovora]
MVVDAAMQSGEKMFFGRRAGYFVAFAVSLLLYLNLQSQRLGDLLTGLKLPDNDDEMRLVSVRDFLNGQGWYDTVQHRAMPPEGLSLHWSRLIDLPLAGLQKFFSLFVGDDMAMALTAAIWPVLLFILYLVIVGRVTSKVFGYAAASFALIAAAVTPTFGNSLFPLGRVDHHNVQVICMLVVISSIILPGPGVRRGVTAGLAAALSLAVGLEAIVVLAVAGIVLTVQHVLDHPGSTDRLMGYGIALGGAAPLLFLIQTDPAAWAVSRCDQLSRPILMITSAAMAFAIITYLSRDSVQTKTGRMILVAVMGAGTMIALWPFLSACREGPFSMLPPDLRDLILNNITESLTAVNLFLRDPKIATALVLPQALVALLLAWLVFRSPTGQRSAAVVLLVFVLMGLAGSFYQARAVIWGVAVMPMAFGVAMFWAVTSDWKVLRWSKPVVLMGVAFLTLYPQFFAQSPVFNSMLNLAGLPPSVERKISHVDLNCSHRDVLSGLNGIDPAGILAPLNMGTKILLYTGHSIFAAPYHRAPEGYWNGTQAFMGSDADMAQRLEQTRADYVLVCEDEVYRNADSIGSRLAKGQVPRWLQPVDLGAGPVRLLRVQSAELRSFLESD